MLLRQVGFSSFDAESLPIMPYVSKKVTNFPGNPPGVDELDSSANGHSSEGDPLKEVNAMVSKLREALREAKAGQQVAEDERDRYSSELAAERDIHRQQNQKHRKVLAEMQARLDGFEQKRNDAAKNREDGKRALQAAQKKIEEITTQRDDVIVERDGLRRDLASAKRRLEEVSQDGLTASREAAELRKNLKETTSALSDAKKQLLTLRQARDTAASNVASLKVTVSELEDRIAELGYRCESAERKVQELASATGSGSVADEVEVLRKEIELLNSAHESRLSEITARHQSEIEDFRKTIEQIQADGVSAEQEVSDDAEVARLKDELSCLRLKVDEFELLSTRFEKQRLETIELSATLENAHRDIRELGASLAEARLLLKASTTGKQRPQSGDGSAQGNGRNRGNSAGRKILGAMRRAAHGLIEIPNEAATLSELFHHSMMLADESEKHGGKALRRVADAFASLLCEAQAMPESVTPALVCTLHQTLDLIGEALEKPSTEIRDALDGLRAYLVEDDTMASDTVASALHSVGITCKATQLPGEALGDLAVTRYDLIILDVGLPEIDGFELCNHIRAMDANADTPIMFLSGDSSESRRDEAVRSGGDDFVSKPFNVAELGLRGLLHVVRARLQIA